MTFLPVVTRELRIAARRRSTYWVRAGAALVLILLGTWLFVMMQRQPAKEIAMFLFGSLSGIAVLYSLIAGVRATSDSLSEEKREGTLGLLFLTDLKGYDVVLGKLAASSLNHLYVVLSVVPMLAIPLLLGGITMGEFGRMALVALNTLFFSLAAGIWMSSMCRIAQRASGLTLAYLLFFSVLLPAFGAMLVASDRATRVPIGLLLPSPGFAYYLAWDTWYRVTPKAFWFALLLHHAMAWLSLALASAIAPHSWQDKPAGVQRIAWRERLRLWTFGNACERAEFRQKLLRRNPFFWLASRARMKPAAVWGVLFALAIVWVWGLVKFRRDFLNEGMFLVTGLVLSLLLRSWLANEASRQIAEDRKAGTLELLLSSPLSVPEILHGQWLAVLRLFLGPLIAVLVVDCLLMRATLAGFMVQDDRMFWASLWIAIMLTLIADLLALYWVGMWQGLTERNPARAAGSTLARILVVPWLGYAVVMLLLVLSSAFDSNRTGPGPTWKFFLGLWFLFGLMTDVGFAVHARHKLLTSFRLAAQQRFSPSQGFWARIFRTEPPPDSGPHP